MYAAVVLWMALRLHNMGEWTCRLAGGGPYVDEDNHALLYERRPRSITPSFVRRSLY
jgi:hypothetical protein